MQIIQTLKVNGIHGESIVRITSANYPGVTLSGLYCTSSHIQFLSWRVSSFRMPPWYLLSCPANTYSFHSLLSPYQGNKAIYRHLLGEQLYRYLPSFWFIWHTCQWAYAIMICPSCVIVISIVVIIGVIYVHLSQWKHWSQKLYILQIYANISLVYAHEILGQCDVNFWNGSHFSKFLNVAFLPTWLSLKP